MVKRNTNFRLFQEVFFPMPLLISLFQDFYRIGKRFLQNDIPVYAAQASFFIVIAAFPFLMLLLTILRFIPSVNKSDLLRFLIQILPDTLDSFAISIINVNDLSVKTTGTILSVTAISTLWTASIGMMGIERGLNRVYECPFKRNYIIRRMISTGYTLVFLAACIMSLFLLVLGSSLEQFAQRYFPAVLLRLENLFNMSGLISFVILFICFIGIYTILPWKKQNPWHQIPGALFSVIGWMVFSYLYSIYFTHFSNYSRMYGSLTAIVLLMLWLYFCICILFLGAALNHHIQNPNVDIPPPRPIRENGRPHDTISKP